jgi:hypothetical protein
VIALWQIGKENLKLENINFKKLKKTSLEKLVRSFQLEDFKVIII